MTKIEEIIAQELGTNTDLISKAIKEARAKCKRFTIPKKNGGLRTIYQPCSEAKMIQNWLLEKIFKKLPVSECATAFNKGASILENARRHRNAPYLVRIDIKNFFQSINFNDLVPIIGIATINMEEKQKKELELIIMQTCFNNSGRLPIGYPTSPTIANIVMFKLDTELSEKINSIPEVLGNASITRYADDFIFSTDKKGACQEFIKILSDILKKTQSPRLEINEAKTKIMSKKGGSALVTGLRIKEDGGIGVHKNYKSHIRLMLKLFAEGRLKIEEHEKLKGHLSHLQSVDPKLFTQLSHKFYKEIAKIRESSK